LGSDHCPIVAEFRYVLSILQTIFLVITGQYPLL
jgi:hypothetical protein